MINSNKITHPLQTQLDELQMKYMKLLDDYEELKHKSVGEMGEETKVEEEKVSTVGISAALGLDETPTTPSAAPIPEPEGAPSPPPPPPTGGFPPPPPPIPGKKGGRAAVPQKPVIIPNVKMKQVNWGKLNFAQAESTIWSKLDDTKIELDVDFVELMFGAKVSVKSDTDSSTTKSTVVTLIDPKKANNCGIMLSKFKMFTFKQLQEAILTIDESILDEENVSSILRFAPSKEDLEAIQGYQGDLSRLGKAEQFYVELIKVPRVVPRLRVIQFKLTFFKVLNDIRPDVDAVLNATKELQNSQKLYKLFEYILAVGNYLNGNSTRGGAFGFKLDSLAKLKDTKSNDPMIPSMLHFIAHLIDAKDPTLFDFVHEISHMEHAAKVNTPEVIAQAKALRKGIEEAEREATVAPVSTDQDPFKNVISSFLISAKSDLKEVEEKINSMQSAFKNVAKLFGEPEAKPEVMFNIFNSFSDSLLKARAENVQKKEAAAKTAAKKKAAMEAALGRKPGKEEETNAEDNTPRAHPTHPAHAGTHASPAHASVGAQLDVRGGMDNMLAALRNGTAFLRGRPTQLLV